MSSQHKAPLAAFVVVSIACIVVVVSALRGDANALGGIFVRPLQSVVAGAEKVPLPHRLLQSEAAAVSGATVGLAAAPAVVGQVIDQVAGTPAAAETQQPTSSAAPAATAPHVAAGHAAGHATHHATQHALGQPLGHVPGPPAHAPAHGLRSHGGGAARSHGSHGPTTPSMDVPSARYVGHGFGQGLGRVAATSATMTGPKAGRSHRTASPCGQALGQVTEHAHGSGQGNGKGSGKGN